MEHKQKIETYKSPQEDNHNESHQEDENDELQTVISIHSPDNIVHSPVKNCSG